MAKGFSYQMKYRWKKGAMVEKAGWARGSASMKMFLQISNILTTGTHEYGGPTLQESSRAAIMKYLRQSGLNTRNLFSLKSRPKFRHLQGYFFLNAFFLACTLSVFYVFTLSSLCMSVS